MTISILTSASSAGILVAKSSLLLALGWSAARLLRAASAATRYAVLLTAIVGVLLIPVLGHFSRVALRVLPADASSSVVRSSATTRTQSASSTSETTQPVVFRLGAPSTKYGSAKRFTIGEMIVMAWAAVAALLLLRLLLGAITVARIVRRGRTIDTPEWTGALSMAMQRVRVHARPRLVMSDEVDMAFAFEAIAPVIVVPGNAQEWSDECRRSVLLHELGHLRRRDLIGQVVAGVATAVYWFNPFMWAVVRRLRIERELACDEIVLSAGVQPSEYAQHLLDMVTSVGRRTPAIAMAMARPSDFEGRLVAILDSARCRSKVAQRHGMIAMGVVAVSAISIGAIAPTPRRAGAARAPGIAFQSASIQVTMAVESAAGRGRVDVLAIDSAAPVLRNGVDLAPLGMRGDYYLFDSTSFVLVHPASKSFSVFAINDAAYNFAEDREGWPIPFEFPGRMRTQTISASESAMRQLERHGAFHVYWLLFADQSIPSSAILSLGRLGVADAPLGESTIVRWFEPALALARLATIDSTWVPNDRIGLTAVAPLVGDSGSTTNFISRNRIEQLRITPVELSQLTLPSDYKAVAIAGSLTESQASRRIVAWRSPP
ncbi:MAG TPA: M56 family metallopeptidase [Gemmatimonadaceae bacterium]|jgi:beta-lactamase regulating signal transducer with metallopeptidase domain